MFARTLDWPPVGVLHTQGRRRYWEAEWLLVQPDNILYITP
ncbi:hypothetical protein L1281_001700 [Neisseria sp. HSC-16F19]|nr:hypothetical protein [Neisseria sp. HSC-16F19]